MDASRGPLGQLVVSPKFACLPQRIHVVAKVVARIDLLLNQNGLFRSEVARLRLASDGMSEAVVGPWRAFGSCAQAQRGLLHLMVRSDEEPRRMGLTSANSMTDPGRDIGRSRSSHAYIRNSLGCILN